MAKLVMLQAVCVGLLFDLDCAAIQIGMVYFDQNGRKLQPALLANGLVLSVKLWH
jgi:hypothetical protein